VIAIAGRTDTMANWVRLTNINSYKCVRERIAKGMDPRRALQM